MLSYWFQQQEEGRAENLFQTHVIVHDRACMLTIDHMSFINAVSLEMVEKLELPTLPLEHNYLLRLGNMSSPSHTKHRCTFSWVHYRMRFAAM